MPGNLYRRGRIWWARVQVNRLEVRKSLRTSDKREARSRLKKLMGEASHARLHGEGRHTWKAAVGKWMLEHLSEVKPSTAKRYKVSIGRCASAFESLYLDQVDGKAVSELVAKRRSEGASTATIRRDLTAVSSVMASCISWGWAEDDPALSFRLRNRRAIKERRDPIRLPLESEIDAVCETAPKNFAKLIRFAQYTGMRQEEIAGLEADALGTAEVVLTRTKTNSPRAVPLDSRASTIVGTGNGRYVFGRNGERYKNVSSRFAAIVRKTVKKGKCKPFRFHDLRHWFAVDYLRRGGSIYDLQQILGHKSIKTTEIYLAFLRPDMRRSVMGVGTKPGTV